MRRRAGAGGGAWSERLVGEQELARRGQVLVHEGRSCSNDSLASRLAALVTEQLGFLRLALLGGRIFPELPHTLASFAAIYAGGIASLVRLSGTGCI
jgi:hypothetical protein